MNTYEIHFGTDAECAFAEIQAHTPEQALEIAHRLWDEDSPRLYFESYRGTPCLEIIVRDQDGKDLASWMDDELRLRHAGPNLLSALRKALAALNQAPRFQVLALGMDSCEIAALCNNAIAEAKGPQ